MDNFYLIPKDGLIVRDPLTGKPLPKEGAPKPRTAYWLRRVRDGDVTEKAPSKAADAAEQSDDPGTAAPTKSKTAAKPGAAVDDTTTTNGAK